MNKNYQIWHKLKTSINNNKARMFFNEGEIWFCNLGLNVGFEQDGNGDQYLRPVLISKKFNHWMMWAVPLTKTKRSGDNFYSFYYKPDVLSTALLSQMKLLDAKRLKYKVGVISPHDFDQIKQKLKLLLE